MTMSEFLIGVIAGCICGAILQHFFETPKYK